MKYEELSERAKEKARDHVRYWGTDHDWWDCLYESFDDVARHLGIEFNRYGKRNTVDILFELGRGGGLSWAGKFRSANTDAEKAINEWKDDELKRIAEQLMAVRVSRRLLGMEPYVVDVKHTNWRSHGIDIERIHDLAEAEQDGDYDDPVPQLMRAFSMWMLGKLKDEEEYLTSDEHAEETIQANELSFDEDGDII